MEASFSSARSAPGRAKRAIKRPRSLLEEVSATAVLSRKKKSKKKQKPSKSKAVRPTPDTSRPRARRAIPVPADEDEPSRLYSLADPPAKSFTRQT